MAMTCSEVTWLQSFLKELSLKHLGPIAIKCDN